MDEGPRIDKGLSREAAKGNTDSVGALEGSSDNKRDSEPAPLRKPRYAIIAAAAFLLTLLICGGVAFVAFNTVEETVAVSLIVKAPSLDERGSRIPVVARRTDSQWEQVVHGYVDSDGKGLELSNGAWEVSPEGSPIAFDGTIYKCTSNPLSVCVGKAADGADTSISDGALELEPLSPMAISEADVSDAIAWASSDGKRFSDSSTDAASSSVAARLDDLVGAVHDKKSSGEYERILVRAKWMESRGWTSDAGLSDMPLGGPYHTSAERGERLLYAIADVNGDGTDELFFALSSAGSAPPSFLLAYTVVDGKAKTFAKSGWYYGPGRDYASVSADGRIVLHGSGGMDMYCKYYDLANGELVLKDSFESDYTSSPATITHDGESISQESFSAALDFARYPLAWESVESYAVSTLSPIKQASLSHLGITRINELNDAMDLIFPSKSKVTEQVWSRVGTDFTSPGTAGPAYQSHFDVDSPPLTRISGYGGFKESPMHVADQLSSIFEGDEGIGSNVDGLHDFSVLVEPLSDSAFLLTVTGPTHSHAASDDTSGDVAMSINAIVYFEGGSTKIAGAIPLSFNLDLSR